jgi:hypothetical protein
VIRKPRWVPDERVDPILGSTEPRRANLITHVEAPYVVALFVMKGAEVLIGLLQYGTVLV